MYSFGIVGLPNVGKSTLFNLLTRASVPVEKYPFSTKDHHKGIVEVYDPRIDTLKRMVSFKEIRPACVEFVDIAGLVKGASKGEGLGNRFLAHIHEVDCIIEVIRCFRDPTVPHITPEIDPVRDIDIVNTELILKDLETISRRKEKLSRILRTGRDRKYEEELEVLERLKEWLNEGKLASTMDLGEKEKDHLKEVSLLTLKPFLYVVNLDEEDIMKKGLLSGIEECAKRDGAGVVALSLKIEFELSLLPEEERRLFQKELGIESSGVHALLQEGYGLLGLLRFFTVEHSKLTVWNVMKGTTVKEAAGKVHSDMEKGFIAAEVLSYEDLLRSGSLYKAKESGFIRLEGKDYIVKDGDIITFRFSI